jgi:hypothetical protein
MRRYQIATARQAQCRLEAARILFFTVLLISVQHINAANAGDASPFELIDMGATTEAGVHTWILQDSSGGKVAFINCSLDGDISSLAIPAFSAVQIRLDRTRRMIPYVVLSLETGEERIIALFKVTRTGVLEKLSAGEDEKYRKDRDDYERAMKRLFERILKAAPSNGGAILPTYGRQYGRC